MGTRILLMIAVSLGWIVYARAQAGTRLRKEASPYLRRAAMHPVDWHPWGADSFRIARDLNRPILLDGGAILCPWCGLMDRDTYTKPNAADCINQHFVAVKVDSREYLRPLVSLQS